MEREKVDATGLSCPLPVVKTREAMDRGATGLEVLVDNPVSRDNVARFAANRGARVEVREENGLFRVLIDMPVTEGAATRSIPGAQERENKTAVTAAGTVVVLSDDAMGRGERELGSLLVKAFLNTLSEGELLPQKVVLYNRGVLLAVEGADTVESLKRMEERGVQLLACGTCLNYFHLMEKLAVGTVSNMFEIIETLMGSEKVIVI